MAETMSNKLARCFACNKEKFVYECEGCSKQFCVKDMNEHLQTLSTQLGELEKERDQFQKILTQQQNDPKTLPLMQEIDEWENDSIMKVKQTAEECRRSLIKHKNDHFIEIEKKLFHIKEQLKNMRRVDEFKEINLEELKTQLTQLMQELEKPHYTKIQEDPTSFISKISIVISSTISQRAIPNIPINVRWSQHGVTVAGGHGEGNFINQLNCPWGLFVDDEQTIVIADCSNHRVVQWKKSDANGQVVAGGNGDGSRSDQLDLPTDVIVDKETDSFIICDHWNRRVIQWSRRSGTKRGQILIDKIGCWGLAMDNQRNLYVSDYSKHEVRRYQIGDTTGTLVAGGNGQGDGLNQLDAPTFIFVDRQQTVYVSDTNNHRVMKWKKGASAGIIVAGGRGQGNALTQLSHPSGLAVDSSGTIYISDSSNNRLLRWPQGATQGTIIVAQNDSALAANQLNIPTALSFNFHGNLYVANRGNHGVQLFSIE